MSLHVHNLTFHYQPEKPVLRNLSVQFSPGKVTAIIGPNGSGKSTLLRLLACVLSPSSSTLASGTITLNGTPIDGLVPARRAALLGYLPQRPSLIEPLTVSQVVRLGRFARPRDEAAVESAIQLVGLKDRAGDLFDQLSAGQQQLASLARVIAQLAGGSGGQSPGTVAGDQSSQQIILADEPVSAQDPRHVTDIMELLRGQAHPSKRDDVPAQPQPMQPRTVIVVLHDFTLAARYADDVVVLAQDGSLAASGPASETLNPTILEQIFQVPFDRAHLIPGDPTSIAVIARSPSR